MIRSTFFTNRLLTGACGGRALRRPPRRLPQPRPAAQPAALRRCTEIGFRSGLACITTWSGGVSRLKRQGRWSRGEIIRFSYSVGTRQCR